MFNDLIKAIRKMIVIINLMFVYFVMYDNYVKIIYD